MPAPIKVHFAIAGAKELDAAFKGVMDRVRSLNALEQKVGLARERAATKGARAMATANDDASKAASRALEKQARDAEKAADRQSKAAEKAADKGARAAEKAAERQRRAAEKAAEAQEKASRRAADKAEKDAIRLTNAQIRETRRAANAASNVAKQRAAGATGILGRAAGGTLSTVGGVAAGLGATVGTYAIGQSLFSNIALQERATQIVNATVKNGKPTQDAGALVTQAQNAAKRLGIDSGDVMSSFEVVAARAGGAEGLDAYMKDFKELTELGKAFGVNMRDMGAVTAAALQAGVQPGAEMVDLMKSLIAQGKEGSVEFKDMAEELPRIAGAGLAFGSGSEMIKRTAGLAQIAVRQKVTPAEARTAVADVFRDVDTHSVELKKSKIATEGEGGKQRDPAEIIADIVDAAYGGKGVWAGPGKGYLKGRPGLSHVFTGTSLAVGSAAAEEYIKAGGGQTGKDAILAMVNKASNATLAPNESRDALARAMATPQTGIDQIKANFEAEIGKLLPEFQKLVPQLAQLTLKFAELAVWVAKNPFEGLGILFAGYLGKEIAAAGIGALLRNAVAGALGASGGGIGSGVGSAVGGAASTLAGGMRVPVGALAARGAMGALTVASGVAAAGTAGAMLGWELGGHVIDPNMNAGNTSAGAAQSALINQQLELERLRKEASRGQMSDESRARLKSLAEASGVWAANSQERASPSGWNAINPDAQLEALAFRQQGGEKTAEGFAKVSEEARNLIGNLSNLNDALSSIEVPGKPNPGDNSRNGRPPGMGP